MKEFNDLEFSNNGMTLQAVMEFDNDYGVSVLVESNAREYELAVLHKGAICYDTHITSDVERWLTEMEVTEIMKEVQQLKKVIPH